MSKNTSAAHAKITIEMMNGMIDQPSSSGIDPWIRCPTASGSLVRYFTAKTITTTDTSTAKNAVTAMMKK
jgi:hypothetical protein